MCEQKHMGSRAVIILCKDENVAASRFGVTDGSSGLIYTRTGRHFFDGQEADKEQALLSRLRVVLDQTEFWEEFKTDWLCLDTELMPWSAKAQQLLVEQYAPVGRAGRDGLSKALEALRGAVGHKRKSFDVGETVSGQNFDLQGVLDSYEARRESLEKYIEAYHQYCWPVDSVDDYRIAPFHILATEGKVWTNQSHIWHMDAIKKYMTGTDPVFVATNHLLVELNDEASVAAGMQWWEELTGAGGEGMVVKPFDFIAMRGNEVLQPAVKCRGREYLRIIYGPEYLLGNHLERLKKRSLGKKRRLAIAEFALGMESLERFVKKEPLYRVHECTFGVLAMESEPVDPRL